MQAGAEHASDGRSSRWSGEGHQRLPGPERRPPAPSGRGWIGPGQSVTSRTVPADLKRGVIAIGNFDGVHVGHQYLIGHAAKIAGALGAPLAILTFEPHPRTFFGPSGRPFRLASPEFKRMEFARLGAAVTVEERFDADLARCAAEEFVAVHLVGRLQAQHVVVGADYRFGAGRGGDAALLDRCAARFSFGLSVVEKLQRAGGAVSSSRVRNALGDGDVVAAADLLGRPWEVSVRVEGASSGFARLASCEAPYLHPKPGLYGVSLHRPRQHMLDGREAADLDAGRSAVARVLPEAAGNALRLEIGSPVGRRIGLRPEERLFVRFTHAIAP